MTPRQFLDGFRPDPRLVSGEFCGRAPLAVEPGDVVGVVLLNLGGPMGQADVEPFLYNLFMDPAIIDIPLPKMLRHWVCQLVASKRSQSVANWHLGETDGP